MVQSDCIVYGVYIHRTMVLRDFCGWLHLDKFDNVAQQQSTSTARIYTIKAAPAS
jgi:hypothetical protein